MDKEKGMFRKIEMQIANRFLPSSTVAAENISHYDIGPSMHNNMTMMSQVSLFSMIEVLSTSSTTAIFAYWESFWIIKSSEKSQC